MILQFGNTAAIANEFDVRCTFHTIFTPLSSFSPCRSSLGGGEEEPKPVRRASLVVGVVASLIIVLSVALVAFTPLLTTEIDKRAEEGE